MEGINEEAEGFHAKPSKLDTARRQRQCFSRGKNVLLHHIRLTKSSNHRSGSAMQAISMFQMEIGVDSGLISEAVLKRITTLRLARVGLLGCVYCSGRFMYCALMHCSYR